jgi:hypothetical protein
MLKCREAKCGKGLDGMGGGMDGYFYFLFTAALMVKESE